MESTYISDEMRSAVGSRIGGPDTSYPVEVGDIRRWAIATYYPEPPPRLYWDAAYAAATGFGGIVAPEDFNPFTWRPQSSPVQWARPEELLGLPALDMRTEIFGGFERRGGPVRIRPGDIVTSTKTLGGYWEKPGRQGLFLMTRIEDHWVNQDGGDLGTVTSTTIRFR